ncbi:hypothetical protein Tco_0419997, partial [Tanacetum coccineum]
LDVVTVTLRSETWFHYVIINLVMENVIFLGCSRVTVKLSMDIVKWLCAILIMCCKKMFKWTNGERKERPTMTEIMEELEIALEQQVKFLLWN